jgi:molybdopterin synthase catalytic subunit
MSGQPLVRIQDSPLSVDDVLEVVTGPDVGGLALFVGLVRDHDNDRGVTRLSYSAHPQADQQLHRVIADVAAEYPEAKLAAVHRVGELSVGDIAVIVAAGCPHRDEAFLAARRLIDDLKTSVPIWKHQMFVDGTDEWVGLP